jgi:hypothetical protein
MKKNLPIFSLIALSFAVLLSACGSERVIKTCFVQLLDAPPEIGEHLVKNLYKDEHFVQLDYSATIVPRSHKGEKAIDGNAPFVFFKQYNPQNNTIDSGTDNYRFDVKFLYDTLGMIQTMNVHIERYEHDYWHSYANPGIFDLQLDKKQSRLKPKQQQKVVLEKITTYIKKCAFK